MTLPELAIRRPITALVILVTVFVMGAIALTRLPLAFLPEIEDRELYVIANYPNASPKAVERLIIRPVEDSLGSMNGLDRMWSRCDDSGGRVNLVFDWSADMDVKRVEIRERLDRLLPDLPEDLEPLVVSNEWNPRVSGETIIEARLSSGRDLSRDYDLLERKIIKPLERLPGVASVMLDGVNPREIKINLRMSALKRHRIDAREIYDMLRNNNQDRSLGVIRDGNQRLVLRAIGSFQSPEEIRELPLPGTTLRLSDVADVTYKDPPLTQGRHLEGQFAIGVSISKESGANTVQVCNAIHERIASMGDDPELDGINFLVWEDQGREITKTIDDLKATGLFGAILAGLVLFLFLRRLSTTLVAIICIPFSLIVACGVVWAQGKSLNTITLLGLIVGIGMLVDNAVVIMENIDRFQRKGFSGKVSALLGAREVSMAVMAATLTSVIVFLPMIFSKPSEMNLILKELAITVCITLLASLFISQTLIPLSAGRLLKDSRKQAPGRIMPRLEAFYHRILSYTLRHRWLAPVVGILVVGSAFFPFRNLDMNFESNKAEMFVGMRYVFSEEPDFESKEKIVAQVEASLEPHRDRLQVKSVYSYWSERWTLTRLYMKDGHTNEAHMNQVRKALPEFLPKIAGLKIEVLDNVPFWERTRGKRVAFQLQGKDTETLDKLAEEAKEYFQSVPGLFDFYTTSESGSMELITKIDRERTRAYQVDVGRPADLVELTFRGRRLPRFKTDQREVNMLMTLEEQDEETVDQLMNLPLLRGEGAAVSLDSLAEFSMVKGPDSITRNEKIINVWVGARYAEGKKEAYLQQVQANLEKMVLPYGYRWEFQAGRREEQASQQEFLINLLLALGLIFAVMAGLFESVRQALSLMISLPFAVAGALWALYLTGTDFDQPASVGFLLLLGIVVNNGIVMIEHFNQYRRAGVARTEAILLGGRERLRPILMTALTTLVGLVPMVVQQPALGGIYYYSMAYVIMGGLLVSTILTTVLLPTTVCIVEDSLDWCGRKSARLVSRLRGRRPAVELAHEG